MYFLVFQKYYIASNLNLIIYPIIYLLFKIIPKENIDIV